MSISTQTFSVACYCRLSQEDAKLGESVSIETQKKILEDFCKEKSLTVYGFYVDDGFTGTNFDRPDFQRMMKDIEAGKVNLVIVKDLSRFGREHLMVGEYIERIFPKMGVRFLALHDDVDTSDVDKKQTDRIMTSVKNIFNELWPAETSDKVRNALEAKASRGEFIGSQAPFGYKKSPEDKHKLIIDEEYAPVVIWMFEMAANSGYGYNKIARVLSKRKIMTPSALQAQRSGREYVKDPYDWNLTTVHSMFRNEVYLGTVTSFKRRKQSYKSDTLLNMPEEKWIVNQNMHDAIISQELWDAAHEKLATRKRESTSGVVNIFAGLVKCDTCGATMSLSNRGDNEAFFACNTYKKKGKDKCSIHYIRYDALYKNVFSNLKKLIRKYRMDKVSFKKKLFETFSAMQSDSTVYEKEFIVLKTQLDKNAKTLKELYEDRSDGIITRDQFKVQAGFLAEENDKLKARFDEIEKLRNHSKDIDKSVMNFLALLDEYENITELDTIILNRFIQRIDVGTKTQADDGTYHQNITITYRFVGKI